MRLPLVNEFTLAVQLSHPFNLKTVNEFSFSFYFWSPNETVMEALSLQYFLHSVYIANSTGVGWTTSWQQERLIILSLFPWVGFHHYYFKDLCCVFKIYNQGSHTRNFYVFVSTDRSTFKRSESVMEKETFDWYGLKVSNDNWIFAKWCRGLKNKGNKTQSKYRE